MTDEDQLGISVHMGITYDTGDGISDHVDITTTDPHAIANAIVTLLRGVAAMHGTDLQLALMTKLGELT